MRHTVFKIFTIGQHEQEEKWLNEMSAKGMQLAGIGLCKYVFEEGTPGEYTYRLELLPHPPTHAESIAYIRFMEDMGVDHVGSILSWVYFRKKADGTPFDLYTDIPSKINHFRRINLICNIAAGMNLFIGLTVILFSHAGHNTGFINIAVALLVFLIGIPIRKNLRRLKKESAVHE